MDDNKYKEGIVDIAKDINENLPTIDRWEYFKHKVKELLIGFAKSKQNIIENRIHYIEKEMDKIEMTLTEKLDYDRLKILERELNEIYYRKTKGFQIRSKAKWIENGGKNTEYLLGLERQHQCHNVIKELKSKKM